MPNIFYNGFPKYPLPGNSEKNLRRQLLNLRRKHKWKSKRPQKKSPFYERIFGCITKSADQVPYSPHSQSSRRRAAMVQVLKFMRGASVSAFRSRFASSSKNGLCDTSIKSPPNVEMEQIVRAISAGRSYGVMFATSSNSAFKGNSLFKDSAVSSARSYGLCHICATFLNTEESKCPQSDFICLLPKSDNLRLSSGKVSSAFAWRVRNSFILAQTVFENVFLWAASLPSKSIAMFLKNSLPIGKTLNPPSRISTSPSFCISSIFASASANFERKSTP